MHTADVEPNVITAELRHEKANCLIDHDLTTDIDMYMST